MNNKKIGVIFLVLSIIIALVIIQLIGGLRKEAKDLGCYTEPGCVKIESNLTITHFAFGVIGFIFALGFYLLFFSKSEEAVLRRLESDREKDIERRENELKNTKFNIILKGLDEYEQKVMKAVREQEGITQNTLRIRADMSKAKLSYVLQDLEKRGLIKRVKKGKTLAIYLKLAI